MSARLDSEVMEQLEKLYRQHVIEKVAHLSRNAAARVSDSNKILFVPPGQNATAVFLQFHQETVDEFVDSTDHFTEEKILQPRRLSLRVF